MSQVLVYVGTYTRRGSEGIYVYGLDMTTGALQPLSATGGVADPSFLALDPQRRHLYAVSEVAEFDGQPSGGVCAYAIAPDTGALTPLNRVGSGGLWPCHISVEATGRYALVANYRDGRVAMLPILADGRLGPASHAVQHEGSSIHPQRQAGPHAHSITPDPANRYALAADLGLDQVLVYRMDLRAGKLHAADRPYAEVKAGAGPRHLDFSPNGKFVYLINEIASTMTAWDYDGARGTLYQLQALPTLPLGFQGVSHCADVHVAPSGRFVYGSNRGHDSIVIYALDQAGRMTLVGHEPTRGKNPRNFAIDPTGTYLLVANQDSDNIVTYRIDPATGKLSYTGHEAPVSMPVCVKITPLPEGPRR